MKQSRPINFHSSLTIHFFICILLIGSLITIKANADNYTRGIGIYPGDRSKDFSPLMVIEKSTYRNLALHRAVYQSGSYNYNLTGQLITDGIKDTELPGWIKTSAVNMGTLVKNQREWLLDRHSMTQISIDSSAAWVQIEMQGGGAIPQVDSIALVGNLNIDPQGEKGWNYVLSGSKDGITWQELAIFNGDGLPGDTLTGFFRRFMPPDYRTFNQSFKLNGPVTLAFWKLEAKAPSVKRWTIAEFGFFNNHQRVNVGGPYQFTSAWMTSGAKKDDWVYVDLGAPCTFDHITLDWIRRAPTGVLQVSDDAKTWQDIKTLPQSSVQSDDLKFEKAVKGRYVRLFIPKNDSGDKYLLSEMQVFGKGGPVPKPQPEQKAGKDGRLYLAGGAWKIQRSSQVTGDGATLSKPGYKDADWLVATVPATVLMSYVNAGAVPHPNYSDNQVMISDSYFYSDFWYRNEFTAPSSYNGQHIFLNFDGINWKATIFLNGKKLGRIEGGFTRGQFDVTDLLLPGQKNALAVCIEKNATPGFIKEQTATSPDCNGGELGADNPTYHASVGWDWIPTIRGRNIGIWNDVYLAASGPVTIKDPFVTTDLALPDTMQADVTIEATLYNHTANPVSGKLRGSFGEIVFEFPVSLAASANKTIKLNPATHPALSLKNPKLWWPAGYGQQNLYPVKLEFVTADNKVSHSTSFQSGVREMTFSEEKGSLRIWINGRRFIGRGGNWGFPESNLCYRDREYDIAVRYHADMYFTMIRNWVGQTGDDEFYEACDRHGVMVWQDFWLANPVDGPNPDDPDMFLRNADDLVKRIRNHPSIGLYCGRNEGNPPDDIDNGLRDIIKTKHAGLHYISNSAMGVVSGGGPYRAQPIKSYFQGRGLSKFHSEMGMPNIVTLESVQEMMPDTCLWPQGRMWGIHDFCLEGAQGGSSFNKMLEEHFGPADNLQDWLTLAQWINYQGYRAMFEAQSKFRMGLLLWMSHSAWPSFVWQTYDYYFEPTAAYFACKKASEPLHIQWNALTDSIEVVNYNGKDHSNLTASIELLNLDGSVQWQNQVTVNSKEDSRVVCSGLEYPQSLSSAYFIRLKLLSADNKLISDNFYWRATQGNDVKAIRTLPKVSLDSRVKIEKKAQRWVLTADIKNNTATPALMVRLKMIRDKSGDRILPVMYSDNYISLMPGEQRTISIELENADTRGEKPQLVLEGINIK